MGVILLVLSYVLPNLIAVSTGRKARVDRYGYW